MTNDKYEFCFHLGTMWKANEDGREKYMKEKRSCGNNLRVT